MNKIKSILKTIFKTFPSFDIALVIFLMVMALYNHLSGDMVGFYGSMILAYVILSHVSLRTSIKLSQSKQELAIAKLEHTVLKSAGMIMAHNGLKNAMNDIKDGSNEQ